jgi:hypothetical protein
VFGSGHPDAGIGLALDKKFADNWILYANLNGVFPTGRIAGLGLQPVVSGLVAVEYLWTENFSITAQFDYYSPPFHGTGTRVLDKGVTESVLGVSYRILPGLLGSSMEWRIWISSPGARRTLPSPPSSPTGSGRSREGEVFGARRRRNLDTDSAICEDEPIIRNCFAASSRPSLYGLFPLNEYLRPIVII